MKVIVAPFHRGADKPASINIPVSGCRSGWYDIHGLIPSLPYRCCHHHVNFSPGGSRMPSKSAYSTAGEMPFNCLLRCGTGRQCAITPAGLWRIEGGDKTVLKSCNFSTAWRRLFAPILVNNAWRALNAPVSKDCSLPSAHFVLLGFPRKDNCRLSDVNICPLTPIIPHNLGLGVFWTWFGLSCRLGKETKLLSPGISLQTINSPWKTGWDCVSFTFLILEKNCKLWINTDWHTEPKNKYVSRFFPHYQIICWLFSSIIAKTINSNLIYIHI